MKKKTTPAPAPILSVSYETVRKIAQSLDKYELTNRRWGRHVANRHRGPRGSGVITRRPLERVEMDNFLLDIHLVDEEGEHIGRPYLTLLIDKYSRMILGYHMSLDTPNAAAVLSAIRHALTLKPPIQVDRQALGLTLDDLPMETILKWPVVGMFDTVVIDNGMDFQSNSVKKSLARLFVEVISSPPREPWYKGGIERMGRTLNQRLIHMLPGTTYGKDMSKFDYVAEKHAVLTLADLRQRLEIMFWIYNRTHHTSLKRTPNDVWVDGVAQWPLRLPPIHEERFQVALCLSDERMLSKDGIAYDGQTFQSDALGSLWNCLPEKTYVSIKIDPTDRNFIYVIDPRSDDILKVLNTRPMEGKVSWSFQRAIKARGKELNIDSHEHAPELIQGLSHAIRNNMPGKGKPLPPIPESEAPAGEPLLKPRRQAKNKPETDVDSLFMALQED